MQPRFFLSFIDESHDRVCSKVREFGRSIDPERHSIDVTVFDTEADHVGKFFGSAWASHWRIGIKPVLHLLWHLGTHWSCEDTRGDCRNSDVVFAQITGHWQDDAINSTLASSVGDLAALSL